MTNIEQAAQRLIDALRQQFCEDDFGQSVRETFADMRQALEQKPCNPSCAPGYCYCEEMKEEPEQEPNCVVIGFTDEGKAIVDHDGLEEGLALYTEPLAVKVNTEMIEALRAFLRAPSVGSSGYGSSTIVVQDFHLRAARAAIEKAESV